MEEMSTDSLPKRQEDDELNSGDFEQWSMFCKVGLYLNIELD